MLSFCGSYIWLSRTRSVSSVIDDTRRFNVVFQKQKKEDIYFYMYSSSGLKKQNIGDNLE